MNLLELVPNSIDEIIRDAETYLEQFPQLSGVNIPDILRIPVRSFEAVEVLLKRNIMAIPHIRSMDNPIEESLVIIEHLVSLGLTHVLIVSGDKPLDVNHKIYPVTPPELIKKIREKFPYLKVYGGLDPYRSDLEKELHYCNEKISSGANGTFTQPFFDAELAKKFGNSLGNTELFFGVSPVLTASSKKYWETKNNVVFNQNFETTLAYNCSISKSILDVAKSLNQHAYIMPIRAPIGDYLKGIFNV